MSDERFTLLFQSARDLLESVQSDQHMSQQSKSKLDQAIVQLANVSDQIRQSVAKEARLALADGLHLASGQVLESFKSAEVAAHRAAERYEKSARLATWKITAVSTGIGVATVLAAFALLRYSLPTREAIDALRAERNALMSNIQQLEARGGRANWGSCAGQTCVQINPIAPEFKDNYRVIVQNSQRQL